MGNIAKGFEFKKFATPRIIGSIAIVVIVLWALSIIFGSSNTPSPQSTTDRPHDAATTTSHSGTTDQVQPSQASHPSTASSAHAVATAKSTSHETMTEHPAAESTSHGPTTTHLAATHEAETEPTGTGHAATTAHPAAESTSHGTATTHITATHEAETEPTGTGHATTTAHPTAAHDAQESAHGTPSGHPLPTAIVGAPLHIPRPKGIAFVEATIAPLNYELDERWWGWRPNDIVDLTDNINNFQMGVLEVTRRTTVALAERISRTGTTDAFDENLEQAMNWFMIKASSFWFPSAESKYRDGLEELQAYLEKLREGNATFYTRTDNLIPLLASFEDLLGSCDENLVKQVNEDGSPVSSFAVDNYFFYTQGVASSMATVLEAVHHDFLLTLESRHGTELLHHAIVSCRQAAEIDPWIILNRDYSSAFANHRANMAAPISHAYFYIGQLIKTLST